MGPGILIPVVIVLVVVPVVFWWARSRLQASGGADAADGPDPSIRLTSNALRSLPAPPWRVVYEVAADKLGGIEHVLIGPGGIFAAAHLDGAPARAGPSRRSRTRSDGRPSSAARSTTRSDAAR